MSMYFASDDNSEITKNPEVIDEIVVGQRREVSAHPFFTSLFQCLNRVLFFLHTYSEQRRHIRHVIRK